MLECGMGPAAVWEKLKQRAQDVGREYPWLGSHVIREGKNELWFHFEDGGLRTLVSARDYGFKETWLSPKVDLCTRQFLFLLEILAPPELEGASVRVDGEVVSKVDGLLSRLTVTEGRHEIRLSKRGLGSVSREVDFRADDRGNIRLVIEYKEIVPAKGPD